MAALRTTGRHAERLDPHFYVAHSRESGSLGVKESGSQRRLSYLEKREYEEIEGRIAEAEERLKNAQAEMANQAGSGDPALMQARYDEMVAAQNLVDQLFERWAELEAKVAG